MGMDLRNTKKGIYKGLSLTSWCGLLYLAEKFGWEPQGTILKANIQYWIRSGGSDEPQTDQELWRRVEDDVKNWCGSYTSNEFQWVTEEDAHNLAAALERALEEIEENKQDTFELKSDDFSSFDGQDIILNKRVVDECASFCRQGEFRIL